MDIAAFLAANPTIKKEDIPADLMTASGSGLDPHISPASASVQLPALANATGLSLETLQAIVKAHTQGKFLGIFGEETVITQNMASVISARQSMKPFTLCLFLIYNFML